MRIRWLFHMIDGYYKNMGELTWCFRGKEFPLLTGRDVTIAGWSPTISSSFGGPSVWCIICYWAFWHIHIAREERFSHSFSIKTLVMCSLTAIILNCIDFDKLLTQLLTSFVFRGMYLYIHIGYFILIWKERIENNKFSY